MFAPGRRSVSPPRRSSSTAWGTVTLAAAASTPQLKSSRELVRLHTGTEVSNSSVFKHGSR